MLKYKYSLSLCVCIHSFLKKQISLGLLTLTELPGAPSNLVISNISPRSATLQFRPGYDGKTAISKWIVEGQVSKMRADKFLII